MIKKYIEFLKEAKEEKSYYKSTNLIQELCVGMLLINNEFLDNILDKGLKARYSENSEVFLTDLKNLLLAKNRLDLGQWNGSEFITDDEVSKINGLFESVEFNIAVDWDVLVSSRITARNIQDKLLSEDLCKLIKETLKENVDKVI